MPLLPRSALLVVALLPACLAGGVPSPGVVTTGGPLRAASPRQDLRATFEAGGVKVGDRAGRDHARLRLRAWGREGSLLTDDADPATPGACVQAGAVDPGCASRVTT